MAIVDLANTDKPDAYAVERAHRRATSDIAAALEPLGHYQSTVVGSLSGSDGNWQAEYHIDPGPRVQLEQWLVTASGEGAEFPALVALIAALNRRPAEPLLHSRYTELKRNLEDAAFRAGYLDAHYRHAELRVEPALGRATALLALETGPRYFVGDIHIEQNTLSEALLSRYVFLRSGEPFDPQQLVRQQFALNDLGYFSSVEIVPQREQVSADHHLPISIRLKQRKRSRWEFGLGYGTDTGARTSVGNELRWLNPQGHSLVSDLQLSEVKNTAQTEYRIPLGRKAGEYLGFSTGAESEILADGHSLQYSLGANLNRSLGGWQRRYYLQYLHEETEIGNEFTSADLLTPGLSLTRAELDDTTWTRRGWYLFGDVHAADKSALSTASFVQARVLGRSALPLFWEGRLLLRAEYGMSLVADFDELPASQRFFAGGDQSVRGYAYESLGPRDAEGNVVGGKYLQTYSIESEFPVWKAVGLALFADAGGAADVPEPDLSAGVGAGLRYRAPFGSLQVDLAHPLEGQGLRLHLGVRVGL